MFMQEPDGLTPEEQIANLRQLIAQKDQGFVQAAVSTLDLEERLAAARAQATVLRAELEVARARQQELENAPHSEDVVKLTAKFLHAQKTMERQHAEDRAELLALRARFQQTQERLDKETSVRNAQASKAVAKIAALEREVIDTRMQAANASESGSGKLALKVAAAAAVAIIAVGVVLGWSQISAKATTPAPRVLPAATPHPVSASSLTASQRGFQGALSSLNNALGNFPDRSPEDVFAEVRHRMAKTEPSICAFQWNNGQPALLYGGGAKTVSIASSLGRCAQAVESLPK